MTRSSPVISFVRVESAQAKIESITSLLTDHFHAGGRSQVVVANREGVEFIDRLLWRFPPDSFLPHGIADAPTDESIVVTTRHENLNRADLLISLTPNINSALSQYVRVIDLEDCTSDSRRALSEARRKSYLEMGFSLA